MAVPLSVPDPATSVADLARELQELLLVAGVSLSGELELPGLQQRVRAALDALPAVARSGLAIYDEEREELATTLFAARSAGNDRDSEFEDDLPLDELSGFRVAWRTEQSADPTPLDRRLRAAGLGAYGYAPLWLRERFLGALITGVAGDSAAGAALPTFLAQLARLLAPVVWNCHTHARFQRGDRRRETLVELGHAINTSLRLDPVLESGRHALQRLAGRSYGALDLLDEGGAAVVSYRSGPRDGTTAAPLRVSLDNTVLGWILQNSRTYESDDLRQRCRFAQDQALRDMGVRRFVAAPMFVRNRIIGCVVVGSEDHRRPLRIDVWLQENIALQLALAIDNARQLEQVQTLSERLAQQNTYLREEIQSEHDYAEMIGASAAMRRVREAIARVASTSSTVLIQGETGVGKELVARAIHGGSPRAGQPMVKVNCAAIPEGMVESELFGHERGAFTSAVERRIGRFELARDGTLFLDEVGELPAAVQAKLLRVLQDGEFERVGGTRTLTSNARIVAATNRDLLKAVQERTFRSDLYYRLNVFPIDVPPLRERREDIPALVDAFTNHFRRRMGRRVERIDAAALDYLCRREWPGNVRELRHVIERALILCDGPVLRVEGAAAPLSDAPAAPPRVAPPASGSAGTLAAVEAEHIRRVLAQVNGVIEGPRGAARLLGLTPSTLRFRMKRLGIRRPGRFAGDDG